MRNLEEDKQFVVNGNHLPLCETELIALHAIDRAILAESKLNIALNALEWYADEQYGQVRFFPPIPDIPILHDCGERSRAILEEINRRGMVEHKNTES